MTQTPNTTSARSRPTAHLWLRDEEGRWGALPLGRGSYALGVQDNGSVEVARDCDQGVASALLTAPRRGNGRETWVLLCPPAQPASVNGHSLSGVGVRVLRDRDQIRLSRADLYISTERLAHTERLEDPDQQPTCGRCRQVILPREHAVVRCPACGAVHHQSEEHDLPCWTYSDTCAVCDQPTRLDAGLRWSPEDL